MRIGARGMTLLETVIGVAILLIVFLGIFGIFKLSMDLVFSTKARTGAVALLHEKMEAIRGLSYASVGTVGGIPSGSLQQTDTNTLNGITYTLTTFVQYADDPADGMGASDSNSITTDYKTVKVKADWTVRNVPRSTFVVTRVAPVGIEAPLSGGTLRVNVFDALAAPLSGATVRIVNAGASPAVDVSAISNAEGYVLFPGAPAAAGYQITVSRSGYSTSQTYSVSGANPNPNPGHVAVEEGGTTTSSFFIDRLGSLTVRTFSLPGPTPLPNISMNVRGTKTIGSTSGGTPIYKMTASGTTDSGGSWLIPSVEWDAYVVTLPTGSSYAVSEQCPSTATVAPGADASVSLTLRSATAHSLRVIVEAGGAPLPGATIAVTGQPSQPSSTCGQAFFPSLSAGTYTVQVSKAGYQPATDANVQVSGQSVFSVTLSP